MPPCHQDCTIRNLLKIAMKELDNLNHVREDLDDLSFNEPGRLAEVTAKLKAVTEVQYSPAVTLPPVTLFSQLRYFELGPKKFELSYFSSFPPQLR
jgi:hypothetical protein